MIVAVRVTLFPGCTQTWVAEAAIETVASALTIIVVVGFELTIAVHPNPSSVS